MLYHSHDIMTEAVCFLSLHLPGSSYHYSGAYSPIGSIEDQSLNMPRKSSIPCGSGDVLLKLTPWKAALIKDVSELFELKSQWKNHEITQ